MITHRFVRLALCALALCAIAVAPALAQDTAAEAAAKAAAQSAAQAATQTATQAATQAVDAAAAEVAAQVAPAPEAAQTPPGRPSPMGMARTTLENGTYVRVVYGRPYKRGRSNIFGTKESEALVPFDQVWRTGANEATEITVTRDVLVAGKRLPAGTYSLFTTPGPDQWQVHFNSALGLDGTGHFDPVAQKFTPADLPSTEVLAVTVPSAALAADKEVDQLTIAFEKTDAGADMALRWILTEVRVPIEAAP